MYHVGTLCPEWEYPFNSPLSTTKKEWEKEKKEKNLGPRGGGAAGPVKMKGMQSNWIILFKIYEKINVLLAGLWKKNTPRSSDLVP